uniref:Reverse transcriptase/retrotransposon-derived protein RNase H-like domain-containing protein n=1 Tax=Moniliophthora roreri TaxID=221103 RepID=A0A0W0FUE4_MONRR
MPDTDKLFVIEADASKWATGAVLRQQGTDGEWHPCGYLSKSLSPTEQNYEIYDWELLAINLTYFRTAQKLNRRQARWSLFLSEFDLALVYVPGKSLTQADALSRQSNECEDEDMDNENVILLPE